MAIVDEGASSLAAELRQVDAVDRLVDLAVVRRENGSISFEIA
jgi:hypothetical protein